METRFTHLKTCLVIWYKNNIDCNFTLTILFCENEENFHITLHIM